jgi:hypothetical protein
VIQAEEYGDPVEVFDPTEFIDEDDELLIPSAAPRRRSDYSARKSANR